MFFQRKNTPAAPDAAVSRQAGRHRAASSSPGCMTVFLLIFFLVGLALFYFKVIRPARRILAARDWIETPCEIVSSKVGEHRRKDHATYSIDITYKYRARGWERRSNRYRFAADLSGDRTGKQAVVDRYPPGKETVCYVDPNNPNEAVIQRAFTADILAGLGLLISAAVGGCGTLAFIGFDRLRGEKAAPASYPPAQTSGRPGRGEWKSELSPRAGPITLKPPSSRGGGLLRLVCFLLFLDGWVALFLWQMIEGLWILAPFMVFAAPLGLSLTISAINGALATFSPRPTLTLGQASVALGGAMRLQWKFDGRTRALRRLRIYLWGDEWITCTRGTDSHTDTHEFANFKLIDTLDPLEMAEGDVLIRVPDDTMHSFDGGNNKIQWSLQVEGEIRRWPNVVENFPILVLPRPIKEAVTS